MTSLLARFASLDDGQYDPEPFEKLCERLGVTVQAPDLMRWALVGMYLAIDQPEFKRERRGRPRKRGWTKDQERFALIDLAALTSPIKRTMTEWIELAKRGELFEDGSFRDVQLQLFSRENDYRASVSRGADVFAKKSKSNIPK